MSLMYEQVKEFHQAFRLPIDSEWTFKLCALRADLIFEEAEEVCYELDSSAGSAESKEKLLKELCDLEYVLQGTLISLGISEDVFAEAFSRVHKSNMSKLDDEGNPIYRGDGKVIKGPNYKEPDLKDLV